MKIEREVSIILGAGASFGSQVGERPPLDGDFLGYAAERFSSVRARGKNRAAKIEWNKFVAELGGTGPAIRQIRTWRLEQLSTFLEARANLKGLQLYQGQPRNFMTALQQLERVIGHTLVAANGTKPCRLHQALFLATKPSTVLTFNYDLIADQSLKGIGWLNASHKNYRGAKTSRILSESGNPSYRIIPHERGHERSVRLIKLHGSIHFSRRGRGKGFGLDGIEQPAGLNTRGLRG